MGNPKGTMLYLEVNDVWGLGLTGRLTVPALAAAVSNLACTAWKGLTGRRGQRGAEGAENPSTPTLFQVCTYPTHTASFHQTGADVPHQLQGNSQAQRGGVHVCSVLSNSVTL